MLDSGQQKRSSGGEQHKTSKNGGPLEMLTIAKRVKIKVPLHQFWNLIINLHYVCL